MGSIDQRPSSSGNRGGLDSSGTCILLVASSLSLAVLVACQSSSRIETLEPVTVDLEWRRAGEASLQVRSERPSASGATVTMGLEAEGEIELLEMTRPFEVTMEIQSLGRAASDAATDGLEGVARRAIFANYPQLSTNAAAAIGAESFSAGEAVIDLRGRPTNARIEVRSNPGELRESGVSAERRPASLGNVRLLRAGRSGTPILRGELSESPGGEMVAVFDLSKLGRDDCVSLKAILNGEVTAVVDGTIDRVGRTFAVETDLNSDELRKGLRSAARFRLGELARGGVPEDLALRIDDHASPLHHGDPLPGARIVNTSDRPVIDISSMLFQVEVGEAEVVFDTFEEPVECLCPGDEIPLPAPSFSTNACLPDLSGADGLRYSVRSTREQRIFGLEAPADEPLPLRARPFSLLEIRPMRPGAGATIEVENRGVTAGTDLVLVLTRGEAEIVIPFPDVPARGTRALSVPAELTPEDGSIWESWIQQVGVGSGDSVIDLSVIEDWRRVCPDAVPARQRLRLSP